MTVIPFPKPDPLAEVSRRRQLAYRRWRSDPSPENVDQYMLTVADWIRALMGDDA